MSRISGVESPAFHGGTSRRMNHSSNLLLNQPWNVSGRRMNQLDRVENYGTSTPNRGQRQLQVEGYDTSTPHIPVISLVILVLSQGSIVSTYSTGLDHVALNYVVRMSNQKITSGSARNIPTYHPLELPMESDTASWPPYWSLKRVNLAHVNSAAYPTVYSPIYVRR